MIVNWISWNCWSYKTGHLNMIKTHSLEWCLKCGYKSNVMEAGYVISYWPALGNQYTRSSFKYVSVRCGKSRTRFDLTTSLLLFTLIILMFHFVDLSSKNFLTVFSQDQIWKKIRLKPEMYLLWQSARNVDGIICLIITVVGVAAWPCFMPSPHV